MARRASGRACSAGSRSRTRVARSDWVAPVHMNAAMTASQSASNTLHLAAGPRPAGPAGSTSTATASTRPAQAAATVAVAGLPVTFHTPARSIRPPSSGRPGQQVEDADQQVGPDQLLEQQPGQAAGLDGHVRRRSRPPARASESSGPAAETRNSLPGVGGSRSISENPPSGYSRMRRTGSPNPRATREWLSSCTSTEAYSSTTKAAATT